MTLISLGNTRADEPQLSPEQQTALDSSNLSPEQKEAVKKVWQQHFANLASKDFQYTFISEIPLVDIGEFLYFQDGKQIDKNEINGAQPYARLYMFESVLSKDATHLETSPILTPLRFTGMSGILQQNAFSIGDDGTRILEFEGELVKGRQVRFGRHINSQLGQVVFRIEGFGVQKSVISKTELQNIFKTILIIQ